MCLLRLFSAVKRKNDRIDASEIADCLRCDFLPECHIAATEIRDRRRMLRYRNLVQRQTVQMKNRISGLLMETGVSYDKLRLHRKRYFNRLLSTGEEIQDSIRPLLQLCREQIDRSMRADTALLRSLERDPLLTERLQRLRTIPGVGPITALTWAVEVGDTSRFHSIKQAIAIAGCAARRRVLPIKCSAHPSPSRGINTFKGRWWRQPGWLRDSAWSSPYCTNGNESAEMQIGPRWLWRASWSLTCWLWTDERLTSLRVHNLSRRPRHKPSYGEREEHQDYSVRRLPGRAVSRPGEGGDSGGSRHICFGTGRVHKLNLRYGLFGVFDRKWMSGPAKSQGPSAERHG